jgi:hypothetical protein
MQLGELTMLPNRFCNKAKVRFLSAQRLQIAMESNS